MWMGWRMEGAARATLGDLIDRRKTSRPDLLGFREGRFLFSFYTCFLSFSEAGFGRGNLGCDWLNLWNPCMYGSQ